MLLDYRESDVEGLLVARELVRAFSELTDHFGVLVASLRFFSKTLFCSVSACGFALIVGRDRGADISDREQDSLVSFVDLTEEILAKESEHYKYVLDGRRMDRLGFPKTFRRYRSIGFGSALPRWKRLWGWRRTVVVVVAHVRLNCGGGVGARRGT